jgi:hypothetical protein
MEICTSMSVLKISNYFKGLIFNLDQKIRIKKVSTPHEQIHTKIWKVSQIKNSTHDINFPNKKVYRKLKQKSLKSSHKLQLINKIPTFLTFIIKVLKRKFINQKVCLNTKRFLYVCIHGSYCIEIKLSLFP